MAVRANVEDTGSVNGLGLMATLLWSGKSGRYLAELTGAGICCSAFEKRPVMGLETSFESRPAEHERRQPVLCLSFLVVCLLFCGVRALYSALTVDGLSLSECGALLL